MVSQAPRLWKQLLQQLEAAASAGSPAVEGQQLQPEVVQAIFDTADSLYDQRTLSKATWKKLVNDMQVGLLLGTGQGRGQSRVGGLL